MLKITLTIIYPLEDKLFILKGGGNVKALHVSYGLVRTCTDFSLFIGGDLSELQYSGSPRVVIRVLSPDSFPFLSLV
jgi:hypothetical protein